MAFWHKKLQRERDCFFAPEEGDLVTGESGGGLLLALFIVFTGIALMSTGKRK